MHFDPKSISHPLGVENLQSGVLQLPMEVVHEGPISQEQRVCLTKISVSSAQCQAQLISWLINPFLASVSASAGNVCLSEVLALLATRPLVYSDLQALGWERSFISVRWRLHLTRDTSKTLA